MSARPPGGPHQAPGAWHDETGPPGAAGSADGVLVVGYGNALRSDDGVGWHAARRIAGDPRFAGAGVRVLALHQLAPELAPEMAASSLVVLIDASTDAAPGTISVRWLAGGDAAPADPDAERSGEPGGGSDPRPGPAGAPRPGPGSTSHHVGPAELVTLAAALYAAVPDVVIVSIGVATLELGEELTPAVAAALPAVADAVAAIVTDLHHHQG